MALYKLAYIIIIIIIIIIIMWHTHTRINWHCGILVLTDTMAHTLVSTGTVAPLVLTGTVAHSY